MSIEVKQEELKPRKLLKEEIEELEELFDNI